MIALPWQPPVYVLLLCTCMVNEVAPHSEVNSALPIQQSESWIVNSPDMARDVDVWRPLVTCDSTTSEGCRTSNSRPPAAWLPDRGDAVAFVRQRKTAGTLLHHHMERVLGLCVSRCVAPDGQCDECLYSRAGCACPTRPARARDSPDGAGGCPYPCAHKNASYVRRPRALSRLPPGAQTHLITMVREPVSRIISEFYFLQPGCRQPETHPALVAWLGVYGPRMSAAVCSGDLATFGTGRRSSVRPAFLVPCLPPLG